MKTKPSLRSVTWSSLACILVLACGSSRREFQDTDVTGTLGNGDTNPDADAGGSLCVSDTLEAEPVPLAMMVVMDRSGSMAGTKWDVARQAMISFADTPSAAGSKMGLGIFPPDSASACDVPSFAPIVPIGLLPDNGPIIKDALLSRPTTGSTPTTPALQAASAAMKAHLAANPDEEGVIILVTDGAPGGCSSTVSNVLSEVTGAVSGTPSIRTFAVGMDGANFANLDQVAQAGKGAPTAFNASGATQQPLIDALEAIRSGALGCEYILPTPSGEQGVLDPESVAIEFTPGKNDPKVTFKRVADASACGDTTGGFYYDDPTSPKRIILCPASCEDVKSGSAQSKVDVFLGCIKKVN